MDHWSSWLNPSPLEHAAVHIFICDLIIFSSWMKDYLGLPSVKKQGCLTEKENLFPPFAVKCWHVVNHFKKGWSGTSLAVQKLRLHAPNAGGLGLIPGWGSGGTKIPHEWSKQGGQEGNHGCSFDCFFFFFFFFLLCSLWDLNFLTRAWTHVHCSGNSESYALDCQGIPRVQLFFLILNFLFGIWVLPINNAVISGEQRRDSAIHIHVSILPQTPLPFRLPHNIEQSSLCYPVGPCWLSILNIAVCICPAQIL